MTDPSVWLMENAAAIVRRRTALELMRIEEPIGELTHAVITQPLIREWLERLDFVRLGASLDQADEESLARLGSMVHGSKPGCLENVYGKLAEFGLSQGIAELDARTRPVSIFRWMPGRNRDQLYRNAWETLVKTVFAWGLLRLGYPADAGMEDFVLSHLETCHKIARDRVYDIYASGSELEGLPKAWRCKPIIKQEVMRDYWLPYIHDLYVFAYLPDQLRSETINQQIADLIGYILDPRFQALREGYGYAWIKDRHTCYGWGWSPHFTRNATFVQRTELLARFPQAHSTPIFGESLAYLKTFQTENGRYCFPVEFLREREGYYVSGSGMGLGENRRNKSWSEIESTFRMLKILTLLGEI